jgi:hypothetical protein
MIVGQLVVMQYFLIQILSDGVLERRIRFPDQVQRLSIRLWQIPQLRSCGFKSFFENSKFLVQAWQNYGVIILVPNIFRLIQFFMPELNILKWIIILYENE